MKTLRTGSCVVLLLILAGRPAGAAVAPHIQKWFDRAQLVIAAEVTSISPYDEGRANVAELRIQRTLKGKYGKAELNVVDLRQVVSLPPRFTLKRYVLTFLAPLKMTAPLQQQLPAGTYFTPVEPPDRALAANSAGELAEIADLVARIAASNRTPGGQERATQAATSRKLTFDLISARHPTLVAEGVATVSAIPDLGNTLTDEERQRIEGALDRDDLDVRLRTDLVRAIAEAGLRQLVPALRKLRGPRLTAACWNALADLGSPVKAADLEQHLQSTDPEWRRVAIAQLVRQEREGAIARVGDVALHDTEFGVRKTAIDALGATKLPAALPVLERAYADPMFEIRQAAAGAIITIGGRPAAETLTRLAFDGPKDGQRFAVVGLFVLGIGKDDPLMRRIAQEHPDQAIRELAQQGADARKR
jgi:HEAT repeat protein